MSSPALISYLLLDEDYDPILYPQPALTNLKAVEQCIKTTLLLFQGEWWENLNLGTPMFQTILGNRATPNGLQIMSAALSARISSVPYVTAVQDVNITFNPANRLFTYMATVQTSFGTVKIINTPGLIAGLEG
jgi:hypothetical protein